jgi:subtilisin family serine protease
MLLPGMDTSQLAGSEWRPRPRVLRAFAGAIVLAGVTVPAGAAGASPAAAGGASAGTAPVTVVAQYAPGRMPPGAVVSAAAGAAVRVSAGGRYVLHVAAGQAPAVVARLEAQPGVRYAEVAQAVHAMATAPATDDPNDICYSEGCPAPDDSGNVAVRTQAYLATIGAPEAWAVSKGDGVTVAVLDSGADAQNPDLSGKIVNQTNVCGSDPGCADSSSGDDFGHGTHVTGILAADTDNGIGVASLGWDVKVDEYKVLNGQGDGDTADVATAIYDAVAAGDRVINMSLANYSCSQQPTDCGPDPDEQAAVEYAIAHNVVVVAAAGNGTPGGDDGLTYPASYPGVLAVAATDDSGAVQYYSQWGAAANIAAPGTDIVSTWNDGSYHVETGTSMATPQVAAAAALLMSHDRALSAQQVTELLEATARPVTGGNPIDGGLLDVPAALAAESHPPSAYQGYDLAGSDGSVYSFGSVGSYGGLSGDHLAEPVVGEALEPDGEGYWLVASDGGVFGFAGSRFYGSTGGVHLNRPVVGMAPTADGRGYWLVASDGGIFAYGDAGFHGSTGGDHLAEPVVGMAPTPDGRGYWLVASDGGIFAFGDAGFYGSTGGVHLNRPVVGMAPTADGRGYWLVASDGGIFAFGDAAFHGSTGGDHLDNPVVGMARSPDGRGYWLAASDGGVFNFGDARFYGSTGGEAVPAPIVAVAS